MALVMGRIGTLDRPVAAVFSATSIGLVTAVAGVFAGLRAALPDGFGGLPQPGEWGNMLEAMAGQAPVRAAGPVAVMFGRHLLAGPLVAWVFGLSLVGLPLALGVVWLRGYLLGASLRLTLAALAAPAVGPFAGLPAYSVASVVATVALPHVLTTAASLWLFAGAARYTASGALAVLGVRLYQLPEAFRRYLAVAAGAVAVAAFGALVEWQVVPQLLARMVAR